jgi:hypothetical protein
MSSACTPRARWAEREAAQVTAARIKSEQEDAERADRIARAEQESLADPDRPRVLKPADWPETITVRIVYQTLPGSIIAETSPLGVVPDTSTSMTLASDDPGTAMAGAEVALAALGYTLDRFRMYQDMSLMVGTFYHKEGPYDAAH